VFILNSTIHGALSAALAAAEDKVLLPNAVFRMCMVEDLYVWYKLNICRIYAHRRERLVK
jgi:hypothetical protein